jgi:hypothetical protein
MIRMMVLALMCGVLIGALTVIDPMAMLVTTWGVH